MVLALYRTMHSPFFVQLILIYVDHFIWKIIFTIKIIVFIRAYTRHQIICIYLFVTVTFSRHFYFCLDNFLHAAPLGSGNIVTLHITPACILYNNLLKRVRITCNIQCNTCRLLFLTVSINNICYVCHMTIIFVFIMFMYIVVVPNDNNLNLTCIKITGIIYILINYIIFLLLFLLQFKKRVLSSVLSGFKHKAKPGVLRVF